MHVVQIATGKPVPAEIIMTSPQELPATRQRFGFNWQDVKDCEIYALQLSRERLVIGLLALKNIPEELRIEIVLLESSKENVGQSKIYKHIAGCLIAFACRLAFLRGYFGFVSLTPKTRLIEHYKTLYGFEQYGRQLAVDMERAQQLIDKYLTDGK